MMELKIIHTADIHFDTAFSGLSETDKASIRQRDLRTVFSKIISFAQNADMLFISGDLFDGKKVSRTTLDFLKREFARIGDVAVFISAGNHDCFDSDSVYGSFDFGDNVHIFSDKPEVVETKYADIYGVSFQSANDSRAFLPMFNVKNPDKINLLVMHGNLSGESYNPIKPVDIENCGMDYIALGHIHMSSGLKSRGNCFYAYPGCPEGRGFDELGEKGILALNVSKGSVSAEFMPTYEKMYLKSDIDVSKAESNEDILSMIQNTMCGNQNIYRFYLKGESSFPIETEVIKNGIDAFDISVIDETVPAVDIFRLSEEFTLKGLFAKFALEDKENMNTDEFELAFKAGLSLIEKEERNENR